MNKLTKDGDRIIIVSEDGSLVDTLYKNTFGTHGHWRGYLAYRPDPRHKGLHVTEFFANLNEIKERYNAE